MPVWLAAVLGAAVGSFLNVCIYRLPRDMSIVTPGSHCPGCGVRVRWYDNIPVLAWFLLRGRCRHCGRKISVRYVLVEVTVCLVWVFSAWQQADGVLFCRQAIFLTVLLGIAVTDFETMLIPNAMSAFGALSGLVFAALVPETLGAVSMFDAVFKAGAGALGGGGLMYLTGWIGDRLFRKESLGGGDIKLLAMCGIWLGIQNVVWVFFIAPFIALPFAVAAKWVRGTERIPFGPFLAGSAAIVFFRGTELAGWVWKISGNGS